MQSSEAISKEGKGMPRKEGDMVSRDMNASREEEEEEEEEHRGKETETPGYMAVTGDEEDREEGSSTKEGVPRPAYGLPIRCYYKERHIGPYTTEGVSFLQADGLSRVDCL